MAKTKHSAQQKIAVLRTWLADSGSNAKKNVQPDWLKEAMNQNEKKSN
jgi:hypothetical protein